MKMDKKKLAAAMAGVFAYIKTQEEAAAFAAASGVPEALVQQPAVLPAAAQVRQPDNLWGVVGRQAHMQANAMMQMRAFK